MTTLKPSCFIVRPGKVGHRLYDNSVPTIFPSFPAYYLKDQRRRKLQIKKVYVSPQKSCEPTPSKVAKVVGSEHSYASSTGNAHSDVKQFKKTVKILKEKVWWQKKKIENMEELMKSLKDKQLVSSQQHNLLEHNILHIYSEVNQKVKWKFYILNMLDTMFCPSSQWWKVLHYGMVVNNSHQLSRLCSRWVELSLK